MKFKLKYFDMNFKSPPKSQFNSFIRFWDKLFTLNDNSISSYSNIPHTSHTNLTQHFTMHLPRKTYTPKRRKKMFQPPVCNCTTNTQPIKKLYFKYY